MPSAGRQHTRVKAGAILPENLGQNFPSIRLPIRPPYPPADARSVSEIPHGKEWLYEPKWDGFRCLAFREGDQVLLQSKAGQPLARYFPELVTAIRQLPAERFVLDGEIVIFSGKRLAFDHLLLRIHPSESRVRKLSMETPATLLCFDLLVNDGKSLVGLPLQERRRQLEVFFGEMLEAGNLSKEGTVRLSPASPRRSQAENWMRHPNALGLDGVIAKRLDEPYRSGERTAMVKIKRIRTADCVVGGFRYASKGGGIGSLLLGLYNVDGLLDHVGFTSSFTATQRQELKAIVEPLVAAPGFTGNCSRWPQSLEHRALQPMATAQAGAGLRSSI